MTQEDKQLLLKDLSARLPYGVICHTEKGDGYLHSINQTLFGNIYGIFSRLKMNYFNDATDKQEVKPYLRTMSSMTEEERKEYTEECHKVLLMLYEAENHYSVTDWLISHHFDFRGLIPMGLALEALEDMYKV